LCHADQRVGDTGHGRQDNHDIVALIIGFGNPFSDIHDALWIRY
jgi:hypothetical protein